MSGDETIKNLKEMACHQEKQIHKLKEKLAIYDEVITKKEELQSKLNDVKRWIEDVELKEQQINTDLLNNLECQIKKLNKSEATVCQLQAERSKLLDLNGRMTEQLRTLKQNEQKLLNSIEELKLCKKRIQSELSNANSKIEEHKRSIEQLSQAIKIKEEEYTEMRRQLDECMMALSRLTDACRSQEKELEGLKRELVEMKHEACKMEEMLKFEQEALSDKLEIMCQRLRELEVEYEEARQKLCDEKANVCKLEKQMVEMREANEGERCETNAKIQKLKNENCIKDENMCQMKSHIADLIRENECKCTEINELKTKVHANECLLEKIIHSSEVFDQMKNNKANQQEQEKCALECDLKEKKKIIGDKKREACCLKNAIKDRDQNNSYPPDRKVCCVRDKIKKIESMNKISSCFSICPLSKCESRCPREKKCSRSYCTLPKESNYGVCPQDNKFNVSSCCSFNRPNKFSADTNICGNDDDNRVLDELKLLYYDLEQLKNTTKSRLARCL